MLSGKSQFQFDTCGQKSVTDQQFYCRVPHTKSYPSSALRFGIIVFTNTHRRSVDKFDPTLVSYLQF